MVTREGGGSHQVDYGGGWGRGRGVGDWGRGFIIAWYVGCAASL